MRQLEQVSGELDAALATIPNLPLAEVPDGVDTMDVFEGAVASAADTAGSREDLQQLVRDVQSLPETQRTALVLREMEALSYDQIADVLDKSVPAVKSLLVRARVTLAERAMGRAA